VTVEAPLSPPPADIGATLAPAGLDEVTHERQLEERELDGGLAQPEGVVD
jgi:hypothetical protein